MWGPPRDLLAATPPKRETIARPGAERPMSAGDGHAGFIRLGETPCPLAAKSCSSDTLTPRRAVSARSTRGMQNHSLIVDGAPPTPAGGRQLLPVDHVEVRSD